MGENSTRQVAENVVHILDMFFHGKVFTSRLFENAGKRRGTYVIQQSYRL